MEGGRRREIEKWKLEIRNGDGGVLGEGAAGKDEGLLDRAP